MKEFKKLWAPRETFSSSQEDDVKHSTEITRLNMIIQEKNQQINALELQLEQKVRELTSRLSETDESLSAAELEIIRLQQVMNSGQTYSNRSSSPASISECSIRTSLATELKNADLEASTCNLLSQIY